MAQTAINPELVTELVVHLALHGKNAGVHGASAILVFMPGLAEITDLFNIMKTHPELGDASRYRILPLHSSLPSQEQKGVFLVPPAGVTKIVLSTNIAETSVTINDISVVIDAGTHKEMQYRLRFFIRVFILQDCPVSCWWMEVYHRTYIPAAAD